MRRRWLRLAHGVRTWRKEISFLRAERGRHKRAPGPDDTVTFPRIPPDQDEDQGDEVTRPDLSRVRPYVRPADDYRGFLP